MTEILCWQDLTRLIVDDPNDRIELELADSIHVSVMKVWSMSSCCAMI